MIHIIMKSASGFALLGLYLPAEFSKPTMGLQCGVCNASIHPTMPTLPLTTENTLHQGFTVPQLGG